MDGNPLLKLRARGQSVWLDDIHRRMLEDGTLARMIDADGITGVTSNAIIFAQAIMSQAEYARVVADFLKRNAQRDGVYDAVVFDDVRGAADLLRPVYRRSDRVEGFVAVEVSARLAYDTEGMVAEGRRMWRRLERENAMIGVPSTREGVAAIRRLIADGINVNATLLFSPARYQEAADAYIAGLEERAARGAPVDGVASVASLFVSRIDAFVDPLLDEHAGQGRVEARALRGRIAGMLAAQAYGAYQSLTQTPRWAALAQLGARPQRLLWASMSTKDSRYSDVKYVEDLIAAQTVCTLPLETLAAYRDHGQGGPGLATSNSDAPRVLRALGLLGIDLIEISRYLEADGVRKFVAAADELNRWLAQQGSI